MMMSTFVSGPTAHRWHSPQLKQLVNNETVLSYRESLTETFSQNLIAQFRAAPGNLLGGDGIQELNTSLY